VQERRGGWRCATRDERGRQREPSSGPPFLQHAMRRARVLPTAAAESVRPPRFTESPQAHSELFCFLIAHEGAHSTPTSQSPHKFAVVCPARRCDHPHTALAHPRRTPPSPWVKRACISNFSCPAPLACSGRRARLHHAPCRAADALDGIILGLFTVRLLLFSWSPLLSGKPARWQHPRAARSGCCTAELAIHSPSNSSFRIPAGFTAHPPCVFSTFATFEGVHVCPVQSQPAHPVLLLPLRCCCCCSLGAPTVLFQP